MNRGFWNNDTTWPHAPGGWVFMAKAVRLLGRCIFSADWSDNDMSFPAEIRLPQYHSSLSTGEYYPKGARAVPTLDDALRASRILSQIKPDLQRAPDVMRLRLPPSLNSGRSAPPPLCVPIFSRDEWNLAKQHIDLMHEQAKSGMARRSEVVTTFRDACAQGALRAAVRPTDDINIYPINPLWWASLTSSEAQFHESCQLSPSVGQKNYQAANGKYGDIFVRDDDMGALIRRIESENLISNKNTISQESIATQTLKQELIDNPELARRDAANIVGYQEGSRPFNRIWEAARKAANLPPRGKPGPKPTRRG